jgi:DNA-binding NtrC family response regulator
LTEPLESTLEGAGPSAGMEVLVVDQDPRETFALCQCLQGAGYVPRLAADEATAFEAMLDPTLRLALVDDASRRSFKRNLLASFKRERPDADVVLMVRRGDVATVVEGMRLGAGDCLVKPVEDEQLLQSLRSMGQARALEREIDDLRVRLERERGVDRVLGTSLGIRRAVDMLKRVAGFPVSVLLLGESGTGKELFAEALHHLSPRRAGPFVAVDCAAIPAELVEAELFGHVKGAFTGALDGRSGRLEEANGGTLFLDEIGNLPPSTQMKLLRVLQERQLFRVGGREAMPLDIRLVAATNVNLRRAIADGHFREDLYHRLAEFTVGLPPLRERGEDIELLARFFLHRFNHRFRRDAKGFSEAAMQRLKAHRWPGNVRELQSAIKQAVILANEQVEVEHLPAALGAMPLPSAEAAGPERPLPVFKMPEGILPLWAVGQAISGEVEKRAIEEALVRSHWDKAKAAQSLAIHFKTLYRKMKEYQIG